MKKLIFLLFLLHTGGSLYAQMSRWILHPVCERIFLSEYAPVVICDSLNTTSLWSLQGKRMAITTDAVHPFVDGYAVTSSKENDQLTGFYDVNGHHVGLNGYSAAYSHYQFSDGFLLVKDNWGYYFISPDGEKADLGNYQVMYPFSQGVAACCTYKDVERRRNPYYMYMKTDNSKLTFTLKGKPVDPDDVQFLSSMSDEGISVAVIKEKLYLYNMNTAALMPAYPGKGEEFAKRQLEISGHESEYLKVTNDSIVLTAYGNKKEAVTFVFNKWMKPMHINFMDYKTVFQERKKPAFQPVSSLSVLPGQNQKVGLKSGDTVILPPQFDEVTFCFNQFAVVRKNDRWGVVAYDESLNYRLTMHQGKNISFRHRDVQSDIKLELPAIINAEKCRFDVDEKEGCVIDKISLETKNTENGNYVYYKCKLIMPKGLPDVLTELQYPITITYDGLTYPTVPIKTMAWHYKYINVALDEAETTVGQGNASFTINILIDKQPGDDDYPFQVTIQSDSVQSELTKISEMRYQCNLYSLSAGVNHIRICIQEVGCPASLFPFDIAYVKPEQQRGRPKVKESISIEMKGSKKAEPEQSVLPQRPDSAAGSAIMSDIIQQVQPVDALQ